MTFLDAVEDKIAEILKLLVRDNANSIGYKFKTTTGTVSIYDEVVSDSQHIEAGVASDEYIVDYNLFLGDDSLYPSYGIDVVSGIGPNADTMLIQYVLIAHVRNSGTETAPRREIDRKMNACFSDLLALFAEYEHLDNTVRMIRVKNAVRQYSNKNDIISTGSIKVKLSVDLSRYFGNPDKSACNL